jgi:hypothetical protein
MKKKWRDFWLKKNRWLLLILTQQRNNPSTEVYLEWTAHQPERVTLFWGKELRDPVAMSSLSLLTSSGIYSNIGAKCLNPWNQFSAIFVKQTKNKQTSDTGKSNIQQILKMIGPKIKYHLMSYDLFRNLKGNQNHPDGKRASVFVKKSIPIFLSIWCKFT